MKSYMDCMDEITADELYEGLLGYGMFAEKLPPIFSSVDFYNYCYTNNPIFDRKTAHKYVQYESIRNTNVPRVLGVPTPMQYAILCKDLSDNWDKIRDVLRTNTAADSYKVSRIHIRKRSADKALLELSYGDNQVEENDTDQVQITPETAVGGNSIFSMNYKNWRVDGDPVLSFAIGKKYIVKTDISQCFPSIYTHAIPWALVGKSVAKSNRDRNQWFNKIDHSCQYMKDGETHGLIIGPHSSNLISEILLTVVDKAMQARGYCFIRNIDDYTCYTESYERAESFLVDLGAELRKIDFLLNHKKTVIEELPQASAEFWVRKLQDKPVIGKYGVVDFNTARSFLDTAVSLMQSNGKNASSITFAIKTLGNNRISNSAKEYCVKTMCHLAIMYPYLIPIMDTYVFDAFNASVIDIESFTKVLYEESLKKHNYEGVSYALFYASKYNFLLNIDINDIVISDNCICKTSMLRYCRIKGDSATENILLNNARNLATSDFDENWIFIYEALNASELKDEWKILKSNNISFLV